MPNGAELNRTLLEEHLEPVRRKVRSELEHELEQFWPLRFGHALDQALQRAYIAGLNDGFVQGAMAASRPEPDSDAKWSCPECGGPGRLLGGERHGCDDGHPLVWTDGYGGQMRVVAPDPEEPRDG
jgi:hypothetical protein